MISATVGELTARLRAGELGDVDVLGEEWWDSQGVASHAIVERRARRLLVHLGPESNAELLCSESTEYCSHCPVEADDHYEDSDE